MGVTSYDFLPENQAQTILQEARQISRERKGSDQRVGGSNLRYFRLDANDGSFVWVGKADQQSPQSPSTGGAFFTITLTATAVQTFLSDVVIDLYTSTDGGATWVPANPPTISYQLERAAPITITPYVSSYLLSLVAPLNTDLAFYAQALSTVPVSIAVTRNL